MTTNIKQKEDRTFALLIKMDDGSEIGIEYDKNQKRFMFTGDKERIDDGVDVFMKALAGRFDTIIDQTIKETKEEMVDDINGCSFVDETTKTRLLRRLNLIKSNK